MPGLDKPFHLKKQRKVLIVSRKLIWKELNDVRLIVHLENMQLKNASVDKNDCQLDTFSHLSKVVKSKTKNIISKKKHFHLILAGQN